MFLYKNSRPANFTKNIVIITPKLYCAYYLKELCAYQQDKKELFFAKIINYSQKTGDIIYEWPENINLNSSRTKFYKNIYDLINRYNTMPIVYKKRLIFLHLDSSLTKEELKICCQ